jgi:hypothetical protein
MIRKRWIKEYRCKKLSTNILKRCYFCKEVEDLKCRGCQYRGNEDNLNEKQNLAKLENYE